MKSFKKRFFKAEKGLLKYFDAPDGKLLGAIPLEGASLSVLVGKEFSGGGKKSAFGVTPLNSMRTYIMLAETDKIRDAWLTYLGKICEGDDVPLAQTFNMSSVLQDKGGDTAKGVAKTKTTMAAA